MKKITLNALKMILNRPLPGAASHRVMWPEGREEIPRVDLYPAATMILIYTRDGRQYFPLIRRSNRKDDAHRGQIGLPGGHHEPGETYMETAVRETEEEIGVQINPQKIAGKLSPLTMTHSGFIVHPFVALTEDTLTFKPDPIEVDEVIPVALDELLMHPENKTFKLENGWEVPGFLFSNVNVWGATAMILNELRVVSGAL
ncbi:TPA: coenzyme A pyrophosphatase [Candidatus Marinimicrobia bacterium]|nr:coenzyme A pyrophosphatase [Candidatus Neomarinimicrobiota bacterium]